ncbi:nucleoredoxin-like protein 1 [Haemaphysalis longicornis]
MVDFFKGKILIKKDGEQHLADTVLSDKKVICLYFAAQWCPPCRMFTPLLANAYKDAKKENLSVEVIFISQDGNRKDMMVHMQFSHGDWYALRFADRLQREIKERFMVPGVLTLLVLRPDGTVVDFNGKRVLQERGVKAFRDWLGSSLPTQPRETLPDDAADGKGPSLKKTLPDAAADGKGQSVKKTLPDDAADGKGESLKKTLPDAAADGKGQSVKKTLPDDAANGKGKSLKKTLPDAAADGKGQSVKKTLLDDAADGKGKSVKKTLPDAAADAKAQSVTKTLPDAASDGKGQSAKKTLPDAAADGQRQSVKKGSTA